MGNIDINKINKKNFKDGTKEQKVEEYCRTMASKHTDAFLDAYSKIPSSRDGKYINSDLMKMTFPFYAKDMQNRKDYNMSITNTAAVLTNEAYIRAIQKDDVERCIFIAGPYGAGKSYFVQSLFEGDTENKLQNSIVYEGSITAPAFEEKIQAAIDNNVKPLILALNPTLELSMRNIKERAKKIGRDVEKQEVLSKYSDFYKNMKIAIDRFEDIAYMIYNKETNLSIDPTKGSTDIEDLYHGTKEEIEAEYERVIALLDREAKEKDDYER